MVIQLLLDSALRLTFSLLIVFLFDAVIQQRLQGAYVLATVLLVIWYLSQLFKQTGNISIQLLFYKMKAGLAMLLYAKLSTMTAYSIKASQTGKITNLLSSDLENIEHHITFMATFLIFPVLLVGYTIIMFVRIGWVGFVGTAMILLLVPITRKVSQLNGQFQKQVNVYKDQRVQATTEAIEGAKFIKLYGW